MSLRRRFTLILVGFAVVLALAGGWLSWRVTSDALEAELDEKLRLTAGAAAAFGLRPSTFAGLTPGGERSPAFRSIRERVLGLRRFVEEAYVFRRDNTLLVSTEDPDSVPIGAPLLWLEAFPEELSRAWEGGEATTPIFRADDGRFYKYGFARLESSEIMLGVLMPADFLEPLNRFRQNLIMASLAAVILAALLGWLLATGIVRPLERLSRVALRIQRGHLARPVSIERADELGRLSRAMERMRQGIVQRDEQLRLMLAQVAHEIRNPLGGLELFASAAAETEDPDERRRVLARIRREVEDLNRIIDDFLTFARPLKPELELHDVRDPLEEAADLASGELERSGGKLSVELPEEPLLAHADPDDVKRVVLNLLRNAGQAGERVWLEADFVNGEVRVVVRDDGPGVPQDLRERIFEPFVTQKEQGAGLGLAIVRRVVEANGGRVELAEDGERSIGRGAEFRVYFGGSEEFAGA